MLTANIQELINNENYSGIQQLDWNNSNIKKAAIDIFMDAIINNKVDTIYYLHARNGKNGVKFYEIPLDIIDHCLKHNYNQLLTYYLTQRHAITPILLKKYNKLLDSDYYIRLLRYHPSTWKYQEDWLKFTEIYRKKRDKKFLNQFYNNNNNVNKFESICVICLESIQQTNRSILSCTHVFCKTCITKWSNFSRRKNLCPLCNTGELLK